MTVLTLREKSGFEKHTIQKTSDFSEDVQTLRSEWLLALSEMNTCDKHVTPDCVCQMVTDSHPIPDSPFPVRFRDGVRLIFQWGGDNEK